MRKPLLLGLCVIAGLIMTGCGSTGSPVPLQTRIDQTEVLQTNCDWQSLHFVEVNRADSLAHRATMLLQQDKDAEAFPLLDQAYILYRLALANAEVQQGEQKLAAEQAKLRDALFNLSTYEQILDEIKQNRGGE